MRKIVSIVLLVGILFLAGCQKKPVIPKPDPDEKVVLTDEQVNEKLNNLNDYGLDLLSKGDHLPLLRNHIYSEQTSSYSRNGNNVDGFGMNGNETGEVSSISIRRPLLILDQPGVVYRMWFTSWGQIPSLRIYVDGEELYNMNFYEMTSGLKEPFAKQLVFNQAESSGGFVSYVPIVFKKSIEIYGRGDFYYVINYQKYPQGTNLDYIDYEHDVKMALEKLENVGSDPKMTGNDTLIESTVNLQQNTATTLYESSSKQTVTSLRIKLPILTVNSFDRTIYDDEGHRLFTGESIGFELEAKEAGKHLLKLRGILKEENQEASLTLNGVKVGNITYRPRRIGGFEWKDDPFFADALIEVNLPSAGKHKFKITGLTPHIDLFNALLVKDEVVDQIDFMDELDEFTHNFTKSALVSPTQATLEYDPNTLIDTQTWTNIYYQEDLVNSIYIKITYPDVEQEAVYAPISSFFGFGPFGIFKTLGLMVGIDEDGWMYSYYPMPFEKGIKIELLNRSMIDFNDVVVEISHETNQFNEGEYGYFKTNYIEHIFNTSTGLQNGKPIEFLKTTGRGHIVGITHAQTGNYFGLHSRYYLEGDEQIYIDGSMSHSFHGTGTEDFYSGGWYFKNGVQNTPLFGQTNHNYRDGVDRTVMVRTFLTDPIYFRSEIDFKMEHGGNNDRADSNVYALTYYYHSDQSSLMETDRMNLTNASERTSHNYQFDDASKFENMATHNLIYEGLYHGKRTLFSTMAHIQTQSSFDMMILKYNEGAILRREYLMEYVNQSAEVYVDDVLVGIWQSPHRNALGFFVRQDDFYIPKSFTEGKTHIKITIKVDPNSDVEWWTESYYQIFTITH